MTGILEMRIGEKYTWNFPAAPGGTGKLLGFPEWGNGNWIAFRMNEEIKFLNLANLNAITPVKS